MHYHYISISIFLLLNGYIKSQQAPSSQPGNETQQRSYIDGCLERENKRRCSTQDAQNSLKCDSCGTDSSCLSKYREIRVSPGNWETSVFYAWIIQIALSEIYDVPVYIEGGNSSLNFYDPDNSFDFGEEFQKIKYNIEALSNAKEDLDCKNKKPCAHVIPEMWPQFSSDATDNDVNQDVNGMIGYLSWFIPKELAERDTSLTSYLGYIGNREYLAQIFKYPVKWKQYCEKFSKTNCTSGTERYPETKIEGERYFNETGYGGYFVNCTGDDCRGHFLDYPCNWPVNTVQQLVHNNIPLKAVSYKYNEREQILKAANNTGSDIIYLGRYPDLHTVEYDPWEVQLPRATQKCINNRIDRTEDSCSIFNETELSGNELGSCGYQTKDLNLGIATSIETILRKEFERNRVNIEEIPSPAFYFLKEIRISSIDMYDMLQSYIEKRNNNTSDGYHAREAVCSWMKSKEDDFNKSLKHLGFPRDFKEKKDMEFYDIAALSFGIFVIFIILITHALTIYYKDAKVIIMAQRHFLRMLTCGYIMVAIGGILYSMKPSNFICIAQEWVVVIGYTMAYMPLLLKINAIHTLMKHAQRCRRVKVSRKSLYSSVGVSILFAVIVLIIWTLHSPPTVDFVFELRGDDTYVTQKVCEIGSFYLYKLLAILWETVHITLSAVLSFRTRNIRSEFNESRKLANMAYVRFVFFVVRLIARTIPAEALKPDVVDVILSFCMSLDSLIAVVLYYGPKIYEARRTSYRRSGTSSRSSAIRSRSVNRINTKNLLKDPSLYINTSSSKPKNGGVQNNTVREIQMRLAHRAASDETTRTFTNSNDTARTCTIDTATAIPEVPDEEKELSDEKSFSSDEYASAVDEEEYDDIKPTI